MKKARFGGEIPPTGLFLCFANSQNAANPVGASLLAMATVNDTMQSRASSLLQVFDAAAVARTACRPGLRRIK
ncbi:hypothetical protein [Andreprevotia chitinilytica]|uniref:hypothetical protein n=1 Tax=Andreprevotia chitinilytica TaxID=396808 RepID=UPI0012EC0756|nr:hypothetical protein [Andreprevotia chitinilytica]